MAPTRSSHDKVVKRRGRPAGRKSTTAKSTAAKSAAQPAASKAKTDRKHAAKPQAAGEYSKPAKARSKTSGKRNDEAADEPDEISVKQPQIQKYVQLAPRTRKIPQEKIDTWPQVSPQVLDQIVGMLRDAKMDIVNTQRDERRAMVAEETLNTLVRRLGRKLSDSRIPPQAKDIHFNIDKLTACYAQLFGEITTERHSKQLLKEQVKVAQHLFEKDQENLEQLKKNAKKWRGEWKHQEKHGRLHPLLQDVEKDETEGDGPEDIGLRGSSEADTSGVDMEGSDDGDLAPLLSQLERSLENMQGNHEQVAGIEQAVQDAQAALDAVLFRHGRATQ